MAQRARTPAPAGLETQALGPVFVLVVVLYASPFTLGRPAAVSVPGLAVGALFAVLIFWWLRRWRMGRRSPGIAVSLVPLVVAGVLLANSLTSIGIIWVTVLVLGYELHERASWSVAVLLGVTTLVVHLSSGSHWGVALSQAVFTVLIIGLGIYLTAMLKRISQVERERLSALAELEVANQELQRRLATEQDLVVAEERARVAAALHDGLGHRLTAIGMSLDFSERMIERDPGRASQEVRHARATTSQALEEMRRVVRAMHPVHTDASDPIGSLRAIAASFGSTGLQVGFDREGRGPVSHDTGLLMVRFAQESLTNVVRHSGANTARLTARVNGDGVEIVVADDGCGGEPVSGYGIPSLTERAQALGGSVTTSPHGGIDGGFRLALQVPAA